VSTAQRIVLVAGAIAAIAILVATPRVVVYSGTVLRATPSMSPALAPIADLRTVGASLAATLVAVVLLWVALGNRVTDRPTAVVEGRLSAVERRVDDVEALITEPSTRK
jgi:hypothetical protein